MADDQEARRCKNCRSEIVTGPWFKRFCCAKCRMDFHKRRRETALRLLDKREDARGDDA
ncbi:MAG: hypothetical protein MJA83_05835 [Gammaproteobacteria bacterium]|nr:hypothetical protein [Gammaproteobacteria bacterium]